MHITGRDVWRVILSIFFIAWGALQAVRFVAVLPEVSFTSAVILLIGLLLLGCGILALFHLLKPLTRLLAVILFLLAALTFLLTLVIHLFNPSVSVSFGSLLTGFMAALLLSTI